MPVWEGSACFLHHMSTACFILVLYCGESEHTVVLHQSEAEEMRSSPFPCAHHSQEVRMLEKSCCLLGSRRNQLSHSVTSAGPFHRLCSGKNLTLCNSAPRKIKRVWRKYSICIQISRNLCLYPSERWGKKRLWLIFNKHIQKPDRSLIYHIWNFLFIKILLILWYYIPCSVTRKSFLISPKLQMNLCEQQNCTFFSWCLLKGTKAFCIKCDKLSILIRTC